ncbi:MAG: Fe-S cluster assembly protein SufD [Lysobacter sp.]|nr:MAG: Fe-S cluster assembly protein SufD [Lysobacter sp.]
MSALLDSLVAPFDALPLREAAGLGPARRDALEAVRRDGLPLRSEAWKYTSLRPLERRVFAAATGVDSFEDAAVLAIPAPRIVFVNGHYDAARTDLSCLPPGVHVEPLSQALGRGIDREWNVLARRFDHADELFPRLNAALAMDGMLLRADAGARGERAIHLVTIGVATGTDAAWHLRHVVDLHEAAGIELVEHAMAAGRHAHLGNSLMHVHMKPGSRLSHARFQEDSEAATLFARTDAVLARDALYRRLDLELGAALSRHELNVALQGERAAVHANGVLLAGGRRHLDTRLGVDHLARDTHCQLTWRGLGAGRSRAAFHGGILIREGADGSEAALSNKNLLLSADAEIDTQPVLEIHADEVKAAHGATVGQLDPDALFYLRSRGVPVPQARALLTAAFCREALGVFDGGPLRDLLTARLDAALVRMEIA